LREAVELLWRFLALANPIFARCDDSSGTVISIFHTSCRDLGEIAQAANIEPDALVQQVFAALNENDYGQYDGLIEVLSPALGRRGLEQLKGRFLELAKMASHQAKEDDRKVIGWGAGGPLYAQQLENRQRELTIRAALQDIADAQGDVDAFIAQHSDDAKRVPRVAVEIAHRLLEAGRVEDAWQAINAVDDNKPGRVPFEWEEMRLKIMEARGRKREAAAFRWRCFEQSLNGSHLRAYLAHLPDFEDVEAEDRAIAHALNFASMHDALGFLVDWPALDKAAALVLKRSSELDGNYYELLTPAADALAGKYPLAATLLLRVMIDFALTKNRATRYRHAARHLAECESLSAGIRDFSSFESHAVYKARLKAKHGRKSSFWSLMS
jgi:hypothetical protein